MTTQQTFTDQLEQLRKLDVRAELKKLDLRNLDLRNIDLDSLDVFDVRETFEKIDQDVRGLVAKLDLPTVDLPPSDLATARAQLDDVRARFEEIAKELFNTAAGFAPVARRDISELEKRLAVAEKAAVKKPAPRKAAARKAAPKKAAAKRTTKAAAKRTTKAATAKKAS